MERASESPAPLVDRVGAGGREGGEYIQVDKDENIVVVFFFQSVCSSSSPGSRESDDTVAPVGLGEREGKDYPPLVHPVYRAGMRRFIEAVEESGWSESWRGR